MNIVYSESAPKALGPYSQAIKTQKLLFISGQGGINPETGCVVEGGIVSETLQIMKNIEAILLAAGSDFSKVVKTTCFLTDMNDFKAFNEIYSKYFESKPARSCVAVQALPANFKVEVEVIAELK